MWDARPPLSPISQLMFPIERIVQLLPPPMPSLYNTRFTVLLSMDVFVTEEFSEHFQRSVDQRKGS